MIFRIRTDACGGLAVPPEALRGPPEQQWYRYVPAARRKSEIFTQPYLPNRSPDGDGDCTTVPTVPRSVYINALRSRPVDVSPFNFRPAYLINQRSKEGAKYRKMTATTSSIECDPFQPDSLNRLRAVWVQIPRICPRRAKAGRQGSAGRPGTDQEQSNCCRLRSQNHCRHHQDHGIVPIGTQFGLPPYAEGSGEVVASHTYQVRADYVVGARSTVALFS